MSRRDIHAEITARIIAALEAGTPPWRRPWGKGSPAPSWPRNGVTGRPYRGINALLLAWHPLALAGGDPRWCTYNQARDKGWQVRKGEKGTIIIFFKRIEIDDDESDDTDDPRIVPVLKSFVVFHAGQIDGMPPWVRPAPPSPDWQAPEAVKVLLTKLTPPSLLPPSPPCPPQHGRLNGVGTGFAFSKDFVLKAGLMLADIASVGFKVENFNHANMETLERNWADVRRALLLTVQLVSSFGFNGQTLRADSALLPIAYYLYRKAPADNYLTHSQHEADRTAIRGWLVRSLLKASGIWGSGLDTLLTALRSTLQTQGFASFPCDALKEAMARRGKSLTFEAEEIEELTDIDYGDKRLFALLALLYPFVDLRNHFHIDHIFPANRFTMKRLAKAGVPEVRAEEWQSLFNKLPNLQLLEGAFNNEKREKLPADWLQARYPVDADRKHYCMIHDLGTVPGEILGFGDFFAARRERIRAKIEATVNAT